MQTVQINISDDKLDTFLTIISNLKNDLVQSVSVSNNSNFEETKAYFNHALTEVENGTDRLLDQAEYDEQMKDFMKTL